MEQILLHYKWTSFDWKIELWELANALKGFENLVKILDINVKLDVIALEKWSFQIKLSPKNITEWVIIGVIVLWIQFLVFTKWDPYKVDLSNSTFNWDVNIVNINWETQTFNKSILPYVRNDNFVKNIQKVSSPLIFWDDILEIENTNNDIKNSVEIKQEYKEYFSISSNKEENNFTIRWWIYEINYKTNKFRIELNNWKSFVVSLSDNIKITDISKYVNTNSLELTWSIKMDKDWNILSMKLFSFNEVQSSITFNN